MSRIAPLVDNLIGTEDADDLMIEIMDVLSDSEQSTPRSWQNICICISTKNTGRYDQNPLVAVTNIFDWGFRGINFHWGQPRQYTFQEVVGQLYQVTNEELQDLNTIPFAKFRINN